MTDCPCPGRITDPARHAAWHAEVVEQGGPAGLVNIDTLRAARGMRTPAPDDHRGRERNLREGKSSPGWRRRNA